MGDLSVAAMNGRLELEEKRSLVLACLRAATSYALRALALSVFLNALPTNAQQVTQVPPFVGTHSETWERFGISQIPSGTSILGGIATISGDELVTFTTFMMCLVHGMPSDGTILMYSDRPSGPLTVSFSQPVYFRRLLGKWCWLLWRSAEHFNFPRRCRKRNWHRKLRIHRRWHAGVAWLPVWHAGRNNYSHCGRWPRRRCDRRTAGHSRSFAGSRPGQHQHSQPCANGRARDDWRFYCSRDW